MILTLTKIYILLWELMLDRKKQMFILQGSCNIEWMSLNFMECHSLCIQAMLILKQVDS
jgi:hypothetical protein